MQVKNVLHSHSTFTLSYRGIPTIVFVVCASEVTVSGFDNLNPNELSNLPEHIRKATAGNLLYRWGKMLTVDAGRIKYSSDRAG